MVIEGIYSIDFDSCSYHWYLADIAFALRDLFEEGIDLTNKSYEAFIDGYKKKMLINDWDYNDIFMFLRFHNLMTYTALLKTIDIDINNLDGDLNWLKNLGLKLETKQKQYHEAFIKYHNEKV